MLCEGKYLNDRAKLVLHEDYYWKKINPIRKSMFVSWEFWKHIQIGCIKSLKNRSALSEEFYVDHGCIKVQT